VVFHKGLGENGKSTVIGAVVSTLSEYAALVPDKLLTGGDNGHETVWMPLRGARLAYLEELPEEHVLPVARIKKLASTPQITAREIGKNNVTWDATHVLIVSTNYFPRVNETDHGTWRRLAMVDYPHKFTGKAKDVRLKARLRTGKGQREAVLAWLVEGAKRWYASGGDLGVIPQSVADSTMEWRTEGDELGKFLAERVKVTGNLEDRLTTKDVLDHFNVWLDANGNRPWSTTLLGQRLRSHHFVTDNPQVTYDRGDRGRQATGLTGARWASWP
jgi:putative DNA primase/helicase